MSELQTVSTRSEAKSSLPPEQYLTFVLGGEVFALGILAIKEIIEYSGITDVPMMPAYLRGVINLRGAVVPVVDLSIRFNRPASPVSKRTCIVIIETASGSERHTIGLVVDAVNAVLDIPIDQIEPPPSFGAGIRTDFISGMARIQDKFVILLDIDHILAFEDVQQIVETAEQPSATAPN